MCRSRLLSLEAAREASLLFDFLLDDPRPSLEGGVGFIFVDEVRVVAEQVPSVGQNVSMELQNVGLHLQLGGVLSHCSLYHGGSLGNWRGL